MWGNAKFSNLTLCKIHILSEVLEKAWWGIKLGMIGSRLEKIITGLYFCPNWTKTKFQFSPVGHYNPCEENNNNKIKK